MPNQLGYDVGLHNGNNTAYYLNKGCRVVAIEANPTLVAQASRRFKREIADERLILVNAAVAETEGSLPFWICE
jgi:FkbM family methyltransferase